MVDQIIYNIKDSLLNSNSEGSTKFVLIMRCFNYEFAFHEIFQ